MSKFTFLGYILIPLSFVLVLASKVEASDLLGSWLNINNDLPMKLASHDSIIYNDKLYLIGGSASTGIFGDQVFSTESNVDSLLNWGTQSTLPERRIWHASVIKDNHVYVLGCFLDPTSSKDNVFMSNIINDSLSQWQEVSPLPQALAQGAAVVVGNRIYFAGGFNSDFVYMADILNDGALGAWQVAGHLQFPLWGFVMVHSQGKLLVLGGETANGDSSDVWSSTIQIDGTLGPWVALPDLPHKIRRGDGALVGNIMVMVGGIDSGLYLDKVYTSFLDSNGNTTSWDPSSALLPSPLCCFSVAAHNTTLYLSGGHDGSAYYSSVYTSHVDTTITPTPTNIPTPTPTPSPTPVPIATTKVIILSGIGGSWNTDALLHCKDDGYSGSWTLAPFAEGIYAPTVKALAAQHWTVNFFGYDWRKPVNSHSDELKQFIDHLTLPQEQVYLVGHSLGALVAQAYLENPENRTKIKKFLAVGGPFMGTPWAYGAWSGGELWNDNLLYQIAGSVGLRRCGGPIGGTYRPVIQQHLPVIKDLLPIFSYLRRSYISELIPYTTMDAQNGWLPRQIDSGFLPNVGTLSGNGVATLGEIIIGDRTRKDSQRNDWFDGRPFTKRNFKTGDGTVLLSSSQISGADNRVIAQSHLGLVMSADGAESISRYLSGLPAINLRRAFNEPTSALIILAEDAQVTQGSGVQSANGNITILTELNPARGRHTLKIRPLKNSSHLSIGKFKVGAEPVWEEFSYAGKADRTVTYATD